MRDGTHLHYKRECVREEGNALETKEALLRLEKSASLSFDLQENTFLI